MTEPISVFVCGVQKGGTTSLYAHLCEHKQLQSGTTKELHIFDNEDLDWASGGAKVPDVSPFFPEAANGRLRFDVTPIYCFWPQSMERIAAYHRQARIIVLFRDPIARAWSHWCMEYARGAETLLFADAIRSGRQRLDGLPEAAPLRRVYSYVERGAYGAQVQRLLGLFPRDQILLLRSEDLQKRHTQCLQQIADHLGVAAFPETGPKTAHRRADIIYPSQLTAADSALIARELRGDIALFAELTGLDVSDWPVMQVRTEDSDAF